MSKRGHLIPPAPPTLFALNAQSVLATTATILAKAAKLQDDLVERYTPDTASYNNVVLPLGHDENARLHFCQQVEFLASTSPDDSLRAACREASKRFAHFETSTTQRADLCMLVAAINGKKEILTTEGKRYLESVLSRFEDRRARLSVDDSCSLERIEKELSQLKQEYLQTCRQESGIRLAQDELEGVNSELLCENDRSEDGSRLRLPFQERAIVLRTHKAQLLGYENYVQMTMRHNLIKSPATVQNLLSDLEKQLSPLKNHLTKRWRDLKSKDLLDCGEEDDGRLYEWDRHFYTQKMMEESYDIDADEISQYFEMSGTVQRTLKIFEDVFGITSAEIDDHDVGYLTNGQGRRALTWHPDVLIFAVWNAPLGDVDEQPFLGYLYMDLFCRPGKRPGFCDLPINPGFTDQDGNRVYPSTCLLCDFDKPTEDRHRFLQHQEVVVLFHELGHGIHDLVAKTEFARFHGASTAEDFNEAPSQMLEHWCWHPEILKSLGRLHNANDEFDQKQELTANEKERSMPDHLIERLLDSRKLRDAVKILGMLAVSRFQFAVGSARSIQEASEMDSTELFHFMMNQTLGMDRPGVFCPAQACTPEHFTVEGLYKYLITQIYASDIFSTVFEKNPMDANAGLRYRRTILENGSSRDEMQMLVDLLGRPPNLKLLIAHLEPNGNTIDQEASSV
ncbi:metallopeptidase MepB [Hortaea werneckii]|nr:metallopeptidase MepB [Hortaea werneckii]KAI6852000.1 metallopeptidase MepB [Hortaea werneckii]KAI6916861.1 metallopeptidase MepB [Hortaea werneckii]KAI6942743.1 metallopeptidase MepB [Hortaea werneckii]KAI6978848.1 metallopeptidase MepB [Hortaea werneckii]